MVSASVETGIGPADDADLVLAALLRLFPDSELPVTESGATFPTSTPGGKNPKSELALLGLVAQVWQLSSGTQRSLPAP